MNDLLIAKGDVAKAGTPTVFAIMRNEMFFLPSFLRHYRSLGIQQFLILDDNSDDGTTKYLSAQPDCVIIKSGYTFSDVVGGMKIYQLWKNWIPSRFLSGQWAICVDADEFLFLPADFASVKQFTDHLDHLGATAVGALMIDFHPRTVSELDRKWCPKTLEELVEAYPYFDRGPYISWKAGSLRPRVISGGVRERLLRQYNINKKYAFSFRPKDIWRYLKNLVLRSDQVGSIHKVPLVKWDAGRAYLHSHTLNTPPDGGVILPIIHFKFTSAFKEKLDVAINLTMAPERAFAYSSYAVMLEKMRQNGGLFISGDSLKFTSPTELFELAQIER